MATRFAFILLFALASQSKGAEPPSMLFQGAAVHDNGAAGGARTSFAIMRLPDGSFAFYDRYAPEKGPLSLPDADGKPHPLLPHLPKEILTNCDALRTSLHPVTGSFTKRKHSPTRRGIVLN